MGYFANLYVVEVDATDRAVESKTTIFGSEDGSIPYFSWAPGIRPAGLRPYAQETIFCDTDLQPLTGYPLVETLGDNADEVLVEANFRPRGEGDAVLIHFVLPENFVPRKDLKPLEQPIRPFVFVTGKRVVATYATTGQVAIRFWISRLAKGRSMNDYAVEKFLHPEEQSDVKVSVELNFGIFKLKLG